MGRGFLNAHMKMHTGETTCDICGLVSYNLQGLKKHKLTHRTKEKKTPQKGPLLPSDLCIKPKKGQLFVCDVCSKGFIGKSQYLKHLESHSKSITFVNPTNDGFIPSDMIKEELTSISANSEEYVLDSKMADVTNHSSLDSNDSKMVETADSNLAGNQAETADFNLVEGPVKLEPIAVESADSN